jgi:hypothetical protein
VMDRILTRIAIWLVAAATLLMAIRMYLRK